MASIGFYKTDITPEKNALVENIRQYLSTAPNKKYVFDIQYFKHELETKIKLSLEALGETYTQNLVDTFDTYNYIGMANEGVDGKAFYYFITGTKWISEKAIELELRMDTINSFQNDILEHFTEKTVIHRQHKDRFHRRISAPNSSNPNLMRLVDRNPEGISNVPLIRTERDKVFDLNSTWIVMYVNDDQPALLQAQQLVYAIPKGGCQFMNGASFITIMDQNCIDRWDSKVIRLVEFPYEPFGQREIISGIYPALSSPDWSIIDVTSSTTGFTASGKVLKLNGSIGIANFTTNLGNFELPNTTIALSDTVINNLSTTYKNKFYESKLLHSDFHTFKFLYDSFDKGIRYEDLRYPLDTATDITPNKGFNITFNASSMASCALMFSFQPDVTTNYKFMTDFEEYLYSNRSLDSLRITDEFVNYIRNGYNYDKKSHDIETTSGIINFGVNETKNGINMAAGFGAGGAGGVTRGISAFGSMVTDTTNAIAKELLYENSLQAKLNQLAIQASSISGADDLSLLEIYNGNKLQYSIYEPTSRMQEVLFDKFYYTGYADEHQGIPDINSRRLFNFIQCEPVFDTEKKVSFYKYLSDIKDRFSAGVTVYHKYGNNTWALDDPGFENWETWICAR